MSDMHTRQQLYHQADRLQQLPHRLYYGVHLTRICSCKTSRGARMQCVVY